MTSAGVAFLQFGYYLLLIADISNQAEAVFDINAEFFFDKSLTCPKLDLQGNPYPGNLYGACLQGTQLLPGLAIFSILVLG